MTREELREPTQEQVDRLVAWAKQMHYHGPGTFVPGVDAWEFAAREELRRILALLEQEREVVAWGVFDAGGRCLEAHEDGGSEMFRNFWSAHPNAVEVVPLVRAHDSEAGGEG